MTTYEQFVTGLAALSITGVKRAFVWGKTPPNSLNTADLPASWVQGPRGEEAPITFTGGSGWPTFRASLVVAIEAAGQDTMGAGFVRSVQMMDAISNALDDARIAKSKCTWSVAQDRIFVAKNWYWCVIAEVTAQG